MTLRLPARQAAELEAVARINDVPVAQEVRDAIARHIEARRADNAFQERLERLVEENREILKRLAS